MSSRKSHTTRRRRHLSDLSDVLFFTNLERASTLTRTLTLIHASSDPRAASPRVLDNPIIKMWTNLYIVTFLVLYLACFVGQEHGKYHWNVGASRPCWGRTHPYLQDKKVDTDKEWCEAVSHEAKQRMSQQRRRLCLVLVNNDQYICAQPSSSILTHPPALSRIVVKARETTCLHRVGIMTISIFSCISMVFRSINTVLAACCQPVATN